MLLLDYPMSKEFKQACQAQLCMQEEIVMIIKVLQELEYANLTGQEQEQHAVLASLLGYNCKQYRHQVQKVLRSLHVMGLVTTCKDVNHSGKYPVYEVTEEGRKVVRAWNEWRVNVLEDLLQSKLKGEQ